MPTFDFHCHPTMKAMLAPLGAEPNPWNNIKVKAKIKIPIVGDIKIGINDFFNEALNSQSSFGQLAKGNVKLIGLALYALEENIAIGLLGVPKVANGDILQISPDKLKKIKNSKNYFEQIITELDFALANTLAPASLGLPAGTAFKLINTIDDYRPDLEPNTIFCLLIIEGLHCLTNNPTPANAKTQVIQNLDILAQRCRLFAVNITHLQQMPFATHASGMQFLKDNLFYPKENGLTAIGKDIIKELYKRKVLVDVKHLGVAARFNLYELRDALLLSGKTIPPIICTHAGIAGVSNKNKFKYIKQRPILVDNKVWKIQYFKKLGVIPFSAFNHSSINLFDEDIVAILGSKGLIGISLDQRIIGYPSDDQNANDFPFDEEFISVQEQGIFFNGLSPTSIHPTVDTDEVLENVEDHFPPAGSPREAHLYYFWNQVIYILEVAQSNPALDIKDAITRICLGSDFDGLINAIDCCTNATQYDDFKNELKAVAKNAGFWQHSMFNKNTFPIDALIDNIFFANAFNFLMQNFK
jgi:microsomal dipeptidase-like Zn-dependent dipeptidase